MQASVFQNLILSLTVPMAARALLGPLPYVATVGKTIENEDIILGANEWESMQY